MPRAVLNLQDPTDLRAVQGQWRFAPGFLPGEPNEGFLSQLPGSPARLADYDDSAWAVCHDLTQWHSRGFTFAWYRIAVTLPETVQGRDIRGTRCLFETCIDDYGEIWINGVVRPRTRRHPGVHRAAARAHHDRSAAGATIHHRPAGR